MKIQRFVAKDSRQAMRDVREAMGGDAVILSSQRVNGGVEVVAATDYDEQLLQARLKDGSLNDVLPQKAAAQQAAPDNESINEMRRELTQLRDMVESGKQKPPQKTEPKQQAEPPKAEQPKSGEQPAPEPVQTNHVQARASDTPDLSGQRTILLSRLMGMGLGRELSMQLADRAPLDTGIDSSWAASMKHLSGLVQESGNHIINNGGCVALVGPTGVGKTTTVAKLAARFALRHGRKQVALITTDCYRIGGQEQIYTFGRILGVPVRLATSREELSAAVAEFADRRLVMIDTAGMGQRDIELMKQFKTLQGVAPDMQIYLTLSATSQLPILDEVVRTFGVSNLAGAIVTKVDETASLGPVLSALVRHRLPAAYIGNGQRVPEDIQLARASAIVKDAQQLMDSYGMEANEWQPSYNNLHHKNNMNTQNTEGGLAINA